MASSASPRRSLFTYHPLPLLVLLLLLFYTFAHFLVVPYAGFNFNPTTGEVVSIDIPDPVSDLQVGDQLLQVGSVSWEQYDTNLNQPLIQNAEADTQIPITVLRNGTEQTVMWKIPGPNGQLVGLRFTTEWWIAFVFWGVGILGFLFLRPRNTLRALFITLCFLTAIWLAGESTVSRWHIWGGALKLRAIAWLLVPAYFFFHWYFLRPLKVLPNRVIYSGFGIATIFALAHTFQLLPESAHAIPISLALLSTLVLLAIHFIRHRSERRAIAIVALGVLLTAGPIIVASLVLGLTGSQPNLTGIVFLAFPALPLAYFYATTRRTLGALETRANRAIALYIFLVLLCTIALVVTPLLHIQANDVSTNVAITLVLMALVGACVALFFAPFERWIEWRLLGIPLPTRSLLETYGIEIASVLTPDELVILLHEQILRSLHVLEAQLLRVNDGVVSELATHGNHSYTLPDDSTLAMLHQNATQYLPLDITPLPKTFQWVRLVLQLRGQNQVEGLWLLGRRDPDDFYAQKEIEMLNAVAAPSGVALTNILRAGQLRDMVQANIARWDNEHKRIAHSLHDKVLQDLQLISERIDKNHPESHERYESLTEYIRHLIADLRPPSLTFGMGLSDIMQSLVDDYAEQHPTLHWHFHQTGDENLVYEEAVTENLYYIAKLACDNIIQHASATEAEIHLQLQTTCVQLIIKDNGVGFNIENPVGYSTILAEKHFGLFHMLERADMINANIRIESHPNDGTSILVEWKDNG